MKNQEREDVVAVEVYEKFAESRVYHLSRDCPRLRRTGQFGWDVWKRKQPSAGRTLCKTCAAATRKETP